MSSIQAVVVDPSVAGRLVLRSVAAPQAGPAEALVRVAAFSLNLGEVRAAMSAEAERRIGWDLAGVVEQEASDGSGPPKGARVVGMLNPGAWAEVVAVPTHILAEIPDSVTFAQAATLPVAGLTAIRALEKRGFLLDRKVLVTGASGGVGLFACELGRQAGAHMIGVVRRPEQEALVKQAGAEQVVIGDDLTAARDFGPYDLILESVGGQTLASALTMLAPDGLCVSFGASSGYESSVNVRSFFITGRASLYGFLLFNEFTYRPGAIDLARLARMIADGRLHPHIDVEAPWTEIANVAQQFIERRITGKAVLHISR